ncbi:MAG: bisanhydrobacterioruberin hydratase, partial [Halobacteria archaeon]|nr:bisanhydrobacterioruberin hydratase [Halobacteria archaeon]
MDEETKADLVERFEEVVSANRFTIAVVFPLTGAVLLLASHEGLLPPFLSFNPYLILFGTLVMRLPLVAGVAPLLKRRATVSLAALTAYAYAIEYVGTTTGFPYGEFEYSVSLGPMLGGVPLGLPIFFLPLVLNSYLLCLLLLGDAAERRVPRLLGTLSVLITVDLVLDPGAVGVGFWRYIGGGFYYGVPLSNYFGWVISGTVSVVLLDVAFDTDGILRRLRGCDFMLDDLVSFVILWGGINLYFG